MSRKQTKNELIEQREREHKQLLEWLKQTKEQLTEIRELLVSVLGGSEVVVRVVRLESKLAYAYHIFRDGHWWLTYG